MNQHFFVIIMTVLFTWSISNCIADYSTLHFVSALSMSPVRGVSSLCWLCICCLHAVFVCNAYELYQVGEWGQVHADGDHAAGEAELVEPTVSLREKRGEVEPTTGQHRPCCKSLWHHQPLNQTQRELLRKGCEGLSYPIIWWIQPQWVVLCRSTLTFCFV